MPEHNDADQQKQNPALRTVRVPQTVQAVPNATNANAELQNSKPVEPQLVWYKDRSFVVSVLGVVIGVVVAVIYGLQLGQMKTATTTSNQTLRNLERARIGVGMFLEPPKPPQPPTIRFEFQNVGRSHGTVVKHVAKKMIGREAELPPKPDYFGATEKRLLMGLQGDKAKTELSYHEAAGTDLRLLETQGRFLIVWGYIEYTDTFNELHRTRFAGVFFPSKNGFKMVDNPNYLESD